MTDELRRMRYFVTVAEELHFGRAAERLHMAQPPLSQAVRGLEESVGARLLERTTRRVALTAAGEAYLRHARDVLARVERARQDARRIEAGLEGRLVVGCVGSATYSLLPRFARALRAELTSVDLAVRGEMLTADQVAALRDGTIDLGLMRPPADRTGVVVTRLRSDRLVLAVPDEHPLARRRRAFVRDLAGATLLTHPGGGRSAMFDVAQRALSEARVAPGAVQEVAETSTLVMFVAAGLGLAVLPEPARALALEGVVWLPLHGVPPVELVAVRRDRVEPHVARAVQSLASAAAAGTGAPGPGAARAAPSGAGAGSGGGAAS